MPYLSVWMDFHCWSFYFLPTLVLRYSHIKFCVVLIQQTFPTLYNPPHVPHLPQTETNPQLTLPTIHSLSYLFESLGLLRL